MIDMMNANQKVGKIGIQINNHNGINHEIMNKIINNYCNIYWIVIYDYSK